MAKRGKAGFVKTRNLKEILDLGTVFGELKKMVETSS
jgi:hypothetical protein